MNLNLFPKDFRESDIKAILSLVLTGKFCQLICVPGAGKATILKLMAINKDLQKHHLGEKFPKTRIIYLDLHDLESFEREHVEKFLLFALDEKIKAEKEPMLLTKQLNRTFANLIEKNFNVIFLLDHFDEFQNKLHTSFYQLLKGFRTLNKYKFSAVFGTRRNLKELVDPQILKDFYDFFTDNTIYLKIYDEKATEVMFTQIEDAFGQKLTPAVQKGIIKLTGGHAKLTKALVETIFREKISTEKENLYERPLIKKALLELWLFLTAQEQQALKKLSANTSGVSQAESLLASLRPPLARFAEGDLRSGHTPEVKTENEILQNLINFNLLNEDLSFTIPIYQQFVREALPTAQEKITYTLQTKEILKGANVISGLLSKQEYRLLRFLVQNEGKILERDEIIQAVWPDAQIQEGISDEAIDQMIFRLRKKIEDEPNHPQHVVTIKGQGLRFTS